jgi:hypothetical protein
MARRSRKEKLDLHFDRQQAARAAAFKWKQEEMKCGRRVRAATFASEADYKRKPKHRPRVSDYLDDMD